MPPGLHREAKNEPPHLCDGFLLFRVFLFSGFNQAAPVLRLIAYGELLGEGGIKLLLDVIDAAAI